MSSQLITLRLPTETLEDLDERAQAAGASRSDYLRALIELPLEIDANAIRRTRRGVDELTPARDSESGITLEIDTPPGTVLAVTDEAIDAVRSEVNAIGINYNQEVRSLNRLVKKYSRNKHLAADEKKELFDVLQQTGKQTLLVYRRAKEIAAKVDALAEKPSVRLEVRMRPIDRKLPPVGEGAAETPANKTPDQNLAPAHRSSTPPSPDSASSDAQPRRKRVRGRHKRSDNSQNGGSSTLGGPEATNASTARPNGNH